MPYKNREEKLVYYRDYYKRLKNGEVLARGTRAVKDIQGQKFGRLIAVEFHNRRGFLQKPYWSFQCDCGNIKVLAAADVIAGKTKSCGCIRNKGIGGGTSRIGIGEASFNSLYNTYKYQAKYRGLEFLLTGEEFRVLTKSNCNYCGIEPLRAWTGTNKISTPYLYNGVDRVDNEEGYTVKNSVACCKICNQAKHAFTLDEFMSWINRLIKFQNLKVTVNSVGLDQPYAAVCQQSI